MATTGKMEYTQADNALSGTMVEYTFSNDGGTTRIYPKAVRIFNDEGSGANEVQVAINSNDNASKTIKATENQLVKDDGGRRIKQFKAMYVTGAPAYRFQAEF